MGQRLPPLGMQLLHLVLLLLLRGCELQLRRRRQPLLRRLSLLLLWLLLLLLPRVEVNRVGLSREGSRGQHPVWLVGTLRLKLQEWQ